jgi:hypothetical protein
MSEISSCSNMHLLAMISMTIVTSCSQGEFSGETTRKKVVLGLPDTNDDIHLGGPDVPIVTIPDESKPTDDAVSTDEGGSTSTLCTDPFVALTVEPGETDKIINNPQPTCFNFVSAVCVGGGGGSEGTADDDSGGGGGALAWFHNKPYVSSDVYKGTAGVRGEPGKKGGRSEIKVNDTPYIIAQGGKKGLASSGGTGGKFTLPENRDEGVEYGGGNGGNGGKFKVNGGRISPGGGGGAGGYSGNGGHGANNVERGIGLPGKGGAGGGGATGCERAGKGGGVGLFGLGDNGRGGGFSGRCKSNEIGRTGFHGSRFDGIAVYGGGSSGRAERGIIHADSGKCRIIFSKERWNWLARTP